MLRQRPVITGEATPYYLFHPRVPTAVHHALPKVKLVAVLRDPAERAVSHYWMEYDRGNEDLPLVDALRAEERRLEPELELLRQGGWPSKVYQTASYMARGHYAEQLDRWMACFDRAQLHLIDFRQLAQNPEVVYCETLRFLGLDPEVTDPPSFEALRVGQKRHTDPETMVWLRGQFRNPNEELAARYGIRFDD
jgi:hypothetical protein